MSAEESPEFSKTSFYALHVALQTLKERCQHLQERLVCIEDENETLRKSVGLDRPKLSGAAEDSPEEYLRGMVGELVHQKSQLTEHIAMVTKENQQLWNRLSKLTKENCSLGLSLSKIREAINTTSPAENNRGRTNNLIRSKTFTRPSPKVRPSTAEEMSLEEISLDLINQLVEGKDDLEQRCGEILETGDNLCFGFKAGSGVKGEEMDETLEKCTSDAQAVKEGLLRQQDQLKQLILNISRSKLPVCEDCQRHGLENETKPVQMKSVDSQTQPSAEVPTTVGLADDTTTERTCPMCGKQYSKREDFENFMKHVELHFIDNDNEMEDMLYVVPNF